MTATYTDKKTGLTLETVNTAALREGDILRNNGCLMKLGPLKEQPNDQGHPERGLTRWARGYIMPQNGTGTIPRPWLDHDEHGNAYWIVQGNDHATWSRFTDPDAVQIDTEAEAGR